MTDRQRRLGRGLEALIAPVQHPRNRSAPVESEGSPSEGLPSVSALAIADIAPNPFQPRRVFDPAELAELESSMHTAGLLQPITVRPALTHGFQLIAGERRLRAATRLGWHSIPAIVREIDDRQMLILSLVENLQRADLHPLDEALGYQRLIDEFRLSPVQIAESVGKDRSTIVNMLRVLSLPDGILSLFRENRLSLGHARALLALPNEDAVIETAKLILDKHLSVRDVERLAQETRPLSGNRALVGKADRAPDTQGLPAEVRRLTELLRRRLQTDVRITLSGTSKGEVRLAFYSAEDLQRLIELVLGRPPERT